MMWGYGWNGLGFLWMFLMGILWLAVLGFLIWALVRWLGGGRAPGQTTPPTTGSGGPSALEIVRQRYARGEIDGATFEQMRERLEGSGGQVLAGAPRTPEEPTTPSS